MFCLHEVHSPIIRSKDRNFFFLFEVINFYCGLKRDFPVAEKSLFDSINYTFVQILQLMECRCDAIC